MERVSHFIDTVTEAVGGLAALLVIPLIGATVWEVFARYVFGAPTIWAFELGYMLMGLHFLLGGALALKRQAHVRIDLIYARLSDRRRAAIDLILYLTLVLPAMAFIVMRFGDYTFNAYLSGEASGQSAWNPVIWPFRAIITFSILMLGLQVVGEVLKCIETIRTGATYPRED